jgi:hypothetical protein
VRSAGPASGRRDAGGRAGSAPRHSGPASVSRVATAGGAAGAHAARVRSAAPLALALSDLGMASGVMLSGDAAGRTIFVPVNPGVAPRDLAVHLIPSPAMPTAKIWASVNGRVIAATALGDVPAVWHVPLSPGMATGGSVPVRLQTAIADPNLCLGRTLDWVEIGPESAITFDAYPQPGRPTVADFFPPFLKHVTAVVPPHMTPAAAQAVLSLGTYLARRYGTLEPTVTVATAWPAAAPDPFSREVWIGGPGTGVVAAPAAGQAGAYALSVGGPDPGTTARALWESSPGVAAIPVQGAKSLKALPSPAVVGAPRVTLAQLGYPSEQARGSGDISISYSFSQADLGGPVDHLGVRLGGVHSPLVAGAAGYLTLQMNGVAFFSEPLSGSDVDVFAAVPDNLLQRDNTLRVTATYTPSGGACSVGALPLALTIYNGSYLSFTRRQALPPGFDRFPQAFASGFDVEIAPLDATRLQEAVTLLQELQVTTRTPLAATLVATPPAAGVPLVVVGASPEAAAMIPQHPFELRNSRGQVVFSYVPEGRFAVLQSFGSTLSLSGPADLAQRLLEKDIGPSGWYSLTGDVLLQGATGPGRTLSVEGSGLTVRPLGPTALTLWQRYRPEGYGALMALLLALLGWMYPRTVRPPAGRHGRKRKGRHER